MKITICTRKFVPPNLVGGVDVYADRLGRAFQRLGHSVHFLAVDAQAEIGKEPFALAHDDHHGMPVTRLKFAFSDRPKEYFDVCHDPDVGRVVRDILQEDRPDLFIVMNFYTITLSVVEAAKSLGIPVVHVATDFLPICRRATLIRWNNEACRTGESVKSCSECFVSRDALGRVAAAAMAPLDETTLVRIARGNPGLPNPLALLRPYWEQVKLMDERIELLRPLRRALDLVAAPTSYTRDMFLRGGFDSHQVALLPFGVESGNPLVEMTHRPSDHIRFLFVGRLQPYKGAHVLIRAFNGLRAPNNATLVIYGGEDGHGDYFEQVRQLASQNDRVQLAGSIVPDDLATAFAQADYFVLPSTWHENSPLILLDALQSGTPVIASEIGGVTDLVRPGENGFLFPPGDENALRKIMQDAIDQPGLIERLRPRTELPTIEAYAQTIIDRAAGIRERELTNTANDMISQADDGLQQLVARI